MTTIVKAKNLADLYDLPPVDWAAVTAPLDRGVTQAPETGGPDRHTTWLTTINADGSPHVTGVGALWVDGTFWFVTMQTSRVAHLCIELGRGFEVTWMPDPWDDRKLRSGWHVLVRLPTGSREHDPATKRQCLRALVPRWAQRSRVSRSFSLSTTSAVGRPRRPIDTSNRVAGLGFKCL
jgi:Pyridoxamine 5'-phosphate oxidase